MFDCHFDLLTYTYMNKNDLYQIKKKVNKVFNKNTKGAVFTLFYMTPKEMKDELFIEEKDINIIENLKEVNRLIKENNLIPGSIEYVYGIEGLDYLEKIEDVDEIYNLGVRSVNIVWNNDNKFGGGAKGDTNRGLTVLGEELVKKLANKRIAIDLSHANEKTFYDIINLCYKLKEEGENPKVYASHSNCKELCNHRRNLNDEQILKIKELNGIIGIVGVKPFCINNWEKLDKNRRKYENAYVEHIKHLKKLLGGVDNIAVSSDDMTYYKIEKKYYKYFNVFKQENMQKKLEKLLLKNKFSKEEIEKILYANAKKFLISDIQLL